MKAAFAAVLLATSVGCASAPLTADAPMVDISALLADPATYDGTLVQVRGAAVSRFEAEFICPELEQIDANRSKECLWLRPGIGEGYGPKELATLHQKWVVMVGRFHASFAGHGGAYGGSITPIMVRPVGNHTKGDIPPPVESSANNSSKPTPLRGAA